MNPDKIAKHIAAAGIEVLAVRHPASGADAMIDITPRVHVRVGSNYANVIADIGGGRTQAYPFRSHVPHVVADIRKAYNLTGEKPAD